MSMNGDTYIIRNGRSTSEVSVYNYPEHLNPFYEDDQHKRLRFWRIDKSNINEGRRRSFSNAIRDMWSFKSFRLKKKSSTLGINKTSESPPPLRRDIQYDSIIRNGLHTYDPRQRYTANGTSTSAGSNFERNVSYRSSLQNMNSRESFSRNDQYRSTIQMGGYSKNTKSTATLTPQLLRNSRFNHVGSSETIGSGISQVSLNSTNPFENDEDEVNESFDSKNTSHTLSNFSPKKHPRDRKKRRAPAPPVPIHNTSTNIEVTASPSSAPTAIPNKSKQALELHISETDTDHNNLDISNLTAEIENFVNNANNGSQTNTNLDRSTIIKDTHSKIDESKILSVNNSEKPNENPQSSFNEEVTKNSKIPKKLFDNETIEENLQLTVDNNNIELPKNISTMNKIENVPVKLASIENTIKIENNSNNVEKNQGRIEAIDKSTEVGHVECIHVHLDHADIIHDDGVNRTTSFKMHPRSNSKPIIKPKPILDGQKRLESLTINENWERNKHQSIVQIESQSPSKTNIASPECIHAKSEKILKTSTSTDTRQWHPKPKINNATPSTTTTVLNDDLHTNQITLQRTTDSKEIPTVSSITTTKVTSSAGNDIGNLDTVKTLKDSSLIEEVPTEEISPVSKISNTTAINTVQNKETIDKKIVNMSNEAVKKELDQWQAVPKNNPLQITESEEDIIDSVNNMHGIGMHLNRTNRVEDIRRSPMEWKQSTLAPFDPHIPPEKRKSVKDIIESINRSQRLLNAAAHKEQRTNSLTILSDDFTRRDSNTNMTNDWNAIRADEILRTPLTTQHKTQQEHDRFPEDACAAPPPTYEESQKLDNSEIIRKCQFKKQSYDYRESSPTSSNLDWNPLPKPKRTKNQQDP